MNSVILNCSLCGGEEKRTYMSKKVICWMCKQDRQREYSKIRYKKLHSIHIVYTSEDGN